jgi:hypothetical protein
MSEAGKLVEHKGVSDEGEVIKRDDAVEEIAAAGEEAAPESNLPPYKLVLHNNQAGESRLASRIASVSRGGGVLHLHDFNPVNITFSEKLFWHDEYDAKGAGALLVPDCLNHRVVCHNTKTGEKEWELGSHGTRPGKFRQPSAVRILNRGAPPPSGAKVAVQATPNKHTRWLNKQTAIINKHNKQNILDAGGDDAGVY